MTNPDLRDETPGSLAATEVAQAEWMPPHLDKLPVEDTAAASGSDITDSGLFS